MILFSLKIPTSCDLKQLIQFSVEVFCTLHMFVDTLALFKKREAKKEGTEKPFKLVRLLDYLKKQIAYNR